MIARPEHIRMRILVPIGCAILLILAGAMVSIYLLQRQEVKISANQKTAAVQRYFQQQLQHEEELLGGLLELIADDRRLALLWQQKDRAGLMRYSEPLFERLRGRARISHLYFITPDRTCFFRAHMPASYGDRIDLVTLDKAVRTNTPASGLELGPYGLFTFRMVQPWMVNGRLVGYIELGVEIDHFLKQIEQANRVKLMFAVDKQLLTRDMWEEGQRIMGHRPEWNRFEKIVISNPVDSSLYPTLDRGLSFTGTGDGRQLFYAAAGGRNYVYGLVPQKDVSELVTGGFIVFNDITLSRHKLYLLALELTAFSVIVAGILFVIFNAYVRRIQNGIIAARTELTNEVDEHKQTAIALTRAKEESDAANRDLHAFSYSVTHDLRAPLTVINGYCEAMLEGYASKLDAQGMEYLRTISSSCMRMNKFIDAILTFSLASQEAIHREPVNLSELARLIMAELNFNETSRQLTVTIADGLTTNGDPLLLRTVMENLLGNAWKFTGKKTQSMIEFGVTERAGERVFFVRDNGAGFDMDRAAELFVPFTRLHDRHEFVGSGIGLATVHKIITRHGGRIWAESAPGEGATFFFTIPDG